MSKGKTARLGLGVSARARLETQLDGLNVLLGGASEAALSRQPAPGKWSAREQLAHLARYHEVFLERLCRILAEQEPELDRYRAEDDVEWPTWQRLPAGEVVKLLKSRRGDLVAALAALTPEQLNRRGRHPVFGSMSLVEWVEFFLAHEGHHLYHAMARARGG